ncbi:hypothetical protein Tco_1168194 [Tanacetum coccineum]
MTGHAMYICFELVGNPSGFKKRSVNGQSTGGNAANNVVPARTGPSEGITHTFTSDQYKRLMSLLSSGGGKHNVMMSFVVDEHVVASGNNKDTEDGNVGQGMTPITTTAPNISFILLTIHESPTTNSSVVCSEPTSYARLVTSKPSRKSLNFRTFIALMENRADLTIPLKSIRAISE